VENIEDLRGKRVRNVTVSIVLQSWRARLVRRASPGMKSPENTGCTVRKLGAARVAVRESGTHELATAKQTVSHELARAEGARGVRHGGYASNKEACFVPYVPYKRVAGAAKSPVK